MTFASTLVAAAFTFVAQAEAGAEAGPEPSAESALLEAARAARDAGDRRTMAQLLLGWASLTRLRYPPAGLEAEIEPLAVAAAEAGPFRLFGSRLDDRVRVGLHDPSGLIGRLEVRIVAGGRSRTLLPLESHAVDRRDYGGAGPIPPEAEVVIEAWMTKLGGEILLRRIAIAPAVDAPTPPGPEVPRPGETTDREEDDGLSWWWIAGGIVAAAFAGAAIWQETRF